MKSLIRILNLNTSNDSRAINKVIINKEGIVACEINIAKKELAVIYDELAVSLEEIINSIELEGYMTN